MCVAQGLFIFLREVDLTQVCVKGLVSSVLVCAVIQHVLVCAVIQHVLVCAVIQHVLLCVVIQHACVRCSLPPTHTLPNP